MNQELKKQCRVCFDFKTLDHFNALKAGKYGKDTQCKECLKLKHIANYKPTGRLVGNIKGVKTGLKLTNDILISRFVKAHGDKYNYSLVDYKGSNEYIKIICPVHGEFEQKSHDHMKGIGCSKCAWCIPARNKLTQVEFIKRANLVHFYLYDYSLVEYKDDSTKVKIICKHHGIFEQQPLTHVRLKNGCPKCGNSYNENLISNFLKEKNIMFESEKTFKDLKLKGKLRFDFYISKLNLIIEFDGKQHFEPVRFRGISEELALEKFHHTKKTDEIKNQYCIDNNINIIRISYFDNIYDKLKEIFNDYKKDCTF